MRKQEVQLILEEERSFGLRSVGLLESHRHSQIGGEWLHAGKVD